MSAARVLIKNTTIYVLGDVFPRILSFITFPILTTHLTPADYGVISYVNTILAVLTTLGFLCINTYYSVYYYRQDSEDAQKRLLGNISIFIVGVNIILSALFFIFGGKFFALLESNISFYPYIALGVGTYFANIFTVLPSALYRLQERSIPFTVLNVTRGLLYLVLTLVLVVYYKYTAVGVLWATFLVSAVYAGVFIVILCRHAIFCIDLTQIKAALRFSLPILPGSIAYFLISMSDRILIDKYLTLTDLGIYSTASTLALILHVMSYGAYKAFEPHIYKTYGRENFTQTFSKTHNAFMFLLLFGVLGLALFAREFFEIMANIKFWPAYFYVPLVLIGVYASAMLLLFGTVITAREKNKIYSGIIIFGGCISLGLNIRLIQRFGLLGASLVSGFVFTAMLGAAMFYCKLKIDYLRPALSIVVSTAAIYFGVYVLSVDSFWARMAVKSVIFITANFVVMEILGFNIRKVFLILYPKQPAEQSLITA
jgi:O-antigen/teichoic acid export membrane protein